MASGRSNIKMGWCSGSTFASLNILIVRNARCGVCQVKNPTCWLFFYGFLTTPVLVRLHHLTMQFSERLFQKTSKRKFRGSNFLWKKLIFDVEYALSGTYRDDNVIREGFIMKQSDHKHHHTNEDKFKLKFLVNHNYLRSLIYSPLRKMQWKTVEDLTQLNYLWKCHDEYRPEIGLLI